MMLLSRFSVEVLHSVANGFARIPKGRGAQEQEHTNTHCIVPHCTALYWSVLYCIVTVLLLSLLLLLSLSLLLFLLLSLLLSLSRATLARPHWPWSAQRPQVEEAFRSAG